MENTHIIHMIFINVHIIYCSLLASVSFSGLFYMKTFNPHILSSKSVIHQHQLQTHTGTLCHILPFPARQN